MPRGHRGEGSNVRAERGACGAGAVRRISLCAFRCGRQGRWAGVCVRPHCAQDGDTAYEERDAEAQGDRDANHGAGCEVLTRRALRNMRCVAQHGERGVCGGVGGVCRLSGAVHCVRMSVGWRCVDLWDVCCGRQRLGAPQHIAARVMRIVRVRCDDGEQRGTPQHAAHLHGRRDRGAVSRDLASWSAGRERGRLSTNYGDPGAPLAYRCVARAAGGCTHSAYLARGVW